MSRITENKAKEYLFNQFKSDKYKFTNIVKGVDFGFDLWLEDKETKEKRKIELKATEGEYERPSSLFQKLYFSASNEVENFEKGETLIARVFLGGNTPRVFLIDNSILKKGARFEKEFRAKIAGTVNYAGSISEIKIDDAVA